MALSKSTESIPDTTSWSSATVVPDSPTDISATLSREIPPSLPSVLPPRPSTVWAIPRNSWPPAKSPPCAVIPELNIGIDEMVLDDDGILEFSVSLSAMVKKEMLYENGEAVKDVRDQEKLAMTLSTMDPDFGFFRRYNEKARRKVRAGLAKKAISRWDSSRRFYRRPTLNSITLNVCEEESMGERDLTLDGDMESDEKIKPLPHIQIPEAILLASDLQWNKRGQLTVKYPTAGRLLRDAVLWLPDSHEILKDFKLLTSLPSAKASFLKNGKIDILRTHIRNGRWTWIVCSRNGIEDIYAGRTADMDDARMAYFRGSREENHLQSFCMGKRLGDRDRAHLPGPVRSIQKQLEPLIQKSKEAAEEEAQRFQKSLASAESVAFIDVFVGENVRLAKAIQDAICERDSRDIPPTKVAVEIQHLWPRRKKLLKVAGPGFMEEAISVGGEKETPQIKTRKRGRLVGIWRCRKESNPSSDTENLICENDELTLCGTISIASLDRAAAELKAAEEAKGIDPYPRKKGKRKEKTKTTPLPAHQPMHCSDSKPQYVLARYDPEHQSKPPNPRGYVKIPPRSTYLPISENESK